ncbi:MAG: PBP1A family penicillin-binding protein [Nitrospiraceae bacterium]
MARSWYRRGARVVGAVAALGLLAFLAYGLYLASVLTLPKGEERPPLLIYGAPFVLTPQAALTEAQLRDRLGRLGYHPVESEVRAPGTYRVRGGTVDLYLKGASDLHLEPRQIRITLDRGVVASIAAVTNARLTSPLPSATLEPQLISGVRGATRQVRTWVPLAEMPSLLIDTVLAVEDRRFRSHFGIDPIAIGRAVAANVLRGEVVQGGSTITQQLAKNLFYTPKRTFSRKLQEAMSALVLEAKYRKDDILETYLNEIYLGQAGSVGIFGVAAAAQRYFGKRLQDLSVEETALIAGLIKGPNTYSPLRDKALATKRRDIVLHVLRQVDRIDDAMLEKALKRPVTVFPLTDTVADAPYFVDYLLAHLEDTIGQELPAGAAVYTTIDPIRQRIADESVAQGLAQLEKAYPGLAAGEEPLQAALLAIDPRTGEIVAMVGGRDYRQSQFNRAVQAKRQPGSLFKPIVYAAAFEQRLGDGSERGVLTAASTVLDEPVSFESGSGTWAPQNYDRQFRGQVTVRTAVEQSLNVPAVRIAYMLGVPPIVQLAKRLGIRSTLDRNLTLALGSASVSLLEMTGAYSAFAYDGVLTTPTVLRHAMSDQGDPLWHASGERQRVLSAQTSYLVTSLLQGVVERGTAKKARTLGVVAPVAGKTGTTDGTRDAWFIGYTPELVVGVWVGFDNGQALSLTGAQAALPIWSAFMRRTLSPASPDFSKPSGVVRTTLDPQSGQVATEQCPSTVTEVFIEGTEPTVLCELHSSGWWDRLKRSFGL